MGNVTIPVKDKVKLSLWQCDTQHWNREVALFKDGKAVGDPVHFTSASELVDIVDAVMLGDYKIFTNQYTFTWDEGSNDNEHGV